MEIHEYLIRHFALIASLRADPHAFFVHTFYYAEEYHQQYLAKNVGGYCGLGGVGARLPEGWVESVSAA